VATFKEIKLGGATPALAGEGGREVILIWDAPSAAGFVVEISDDLSIWNSLPVQPRTSSTGLRTWETRVSVPAGRHHFFRIRWAGLAQAPDR
jgi:hypothetical protein